MHRILLFAGALVLAAAPAIAQSQAVDPVGRSILFIRGANGSGGATEGGTTAQRTEQLGDVFNTSTAKGNHGYDTLRKTLVADGFTVAQQIESSTALSLATLLKYRVVVFGSNNKVYTAAEVAAFHSYVDRGGSALFISDANWGLTWEAAPASDNQFLGRYGVQVYQDGGHLPTMDRATSGRYLMPGHAALSGPDGVGVTDNVNKYNGEGVSMFRITKGSSGFQAVRVVSATGLSVRLNTTTGKAGAVRAAGNGDCAMWFAEKGDSRLLGHFDRNTFFNQSGAGTDIEKLDNKRLARNIFRYLASVPASARSIGTGCGKTGAPILLVTPPIIGRKHAFVLSGASANAPGLILFGAGFAKPLAFPGGCVTYVDLSTLFVAGPFTTSSTGAFTTSFQVPASLSLSGRRATTQLATFVLGGPFLGGAELSNAVTLVVGY